MFALIVNTILISNPPTINNLDDSLVTWLYDADHPQQLDTSIPNSYLNNNNDPDTTIKWLYGNNIDNSYLDDTEIQTQNTIKWLYGSDQSIDSYHNSDVDLNQRETIKWLYGGNTNSYPSYTSDTSDTSDTSYTSDTSDTSDIWENSIEGWSYVDVDAVDTVDVDSQNLVSVMIIILGITMMVVVAFTSIIIGIYKRYGEKDYRLMVNRDPAADRVSNGLTGDLV